MAASADNASIYTEARLLVTDRLQPPIKLGAGAPGFLRRSTLFLTVNSSIIFPLPGCMLIPSFVLNLQHGILLFQRLGGCQLQIEGIKVPLRCLTGGDIAGIGSDN